jgi:dimethylglycine dehydrogenase
MKSHARAVVIGGGIAGCSTLYHLTKMGWNDVVLLERDELSSGSTWHAAGNCPIFSTNFNIFKMQRYSIDLYHKLQAETDQFVSAHQTGSVRLANNPERLDEYRRVVGIARSMGVEMNIVSPGEIKNHHPFINPDGLEGALIDQFDGHVDPSSVVQGLAKGARMGGAEIYRRTNVEGIMRKPNGEWEVKTSEGTITCEVIVNAAGFRAIEVADMVGHHLPMISMEHEYIVTDDIKEIEEYGKELPLMREVDVSYYLRQEGRTLILGPYEKDCVPWAVDGVPPHFGQELLPPDLDRLQDIFEGAIHRVPVLGTAGVKTIVNGPITYTPDGGPLVGPAAGIDNYFMCTAFSFGIVQGGGAGKFTAQWIVEGEPEIDLWDTDPRRFGPYATQQYALEKITEFYGMEYAIAYPGEERETGRRAKTSPIYDRLAARGAVFGQKFGWERANWFAPEGVAREDVLSFHHTNWFEHAGNECKAVRERVGILDLSGFAKYEISGPGAEAYLNHLVANRVPKRIGGIVLAHALTPSGGIMAEYTITKVGAERFYLVSAAAAELHDFDVLRVALPRDGSVTLENVTARWGTLVLAGPRSREVLAKLTKTDLSNDAFKWLTAQEIEIGYAKVRALRVNYVGELGWELHHPIETQTQLYDAIIEAGAEFGIADFGLRAMESLRMEKAYAMWQLELTAEYTPLEAGLDRFVKFDKGDFVGRDALLRQKEKGSAWKLVCLDIEAGDADAYGREPVLSDGKVVGMVCSGAYGHHVGKTIALAYVVPGFAAPGTKLAVDILEQRHAATVLADAPYDPENKRPRM